MSEELVSAFIDLFDGNRKAVGAEDGGCIRIDDRLRWTAFISNHLEQGGQHAIGVYPLRFRTASSGENGWYVKWGCVDWDEGEDASWRHAVRTQALLAKVGVTMWLERTRAKGYHGWVFADTWTPAWVVRRGLLKACTAVGAPIKEVNPKSEGTDDPQFMSNYVRVPYPGILAMPTEIGLVGARRVMVDADGVTIPFKTFMDSAIAARGLQGLERLAALWQPPRPIIQRNLVEIDDEQLEQALERVSTRTIGVLLDGPTRGQGRSETLFWLAQMLHRDGNHTFDECVALLKHADSIWGKFHERPDYERRILECVEKSWSD